MTVHLVLHSHLDAGWFKTPDEYFSGGSKEGIHGAAKTALDAVLDEMAKDSRRRFTFADIKFISWWWRSLADEKRPIFKDLVRRRQIEIAQGSWVSTDEATTNYEDIILNMQMGHEFLYAEFGIRPRVGWMPDEFGHSAANAALYSDFGFDAMIISRIPDDVKAARNQSEGLAFVWKPFSRHFGDNKEILTHVTATQYDGPDGIIRNDIERGSPDEDAVQNDTTLEGYNSLLKVSHLVNHVQALTRAYPSKANIMVIMGEDFGYMDAFDGFRQADELIALANKHQERNMTFIYSTPSQFLEAVKKEDITWPVYYGDLFPYHQHRYEYWTGYYSSRAAFKK